MSWSSESTAEFSFRPVYAFGGRADECRHDESTSRQSSIDDGDTQHDELASGAVE